MTTFRGSPISSKSAAGALLHEVAIDGVTYSAVRFPHAAAVRVIATKMVGGKLMKLTCQIDERSVYDELGSLPSTPDNFGGTAIRIGWERLKDEVRYHEEKATGVDPIQSRYADEAIDAAILRNAEDAKRREEAARKEKLRLAQEKKDREKQEMIEEAGDLWGQF